jgi:hypothetical protein
MRSRVKKILALSLVIVIAVLLFGGQIELNTLGTGETSLVSIAQIGIAQLLAALIAIVCLEVHRWSRKK